jgi:hypothetical protein
MHYVIDSCWVLYHNVIIYYASGLVVSWALSFQLNKKMHGKCMKRPFFNLPYFARGGAISETNQPWHQYRPPAAPNTTNRYPDASNR